MNRNDVDIRGSLTRRAASDPGVLVTSDSLHPSLLLHKSADSTSFRLLPPASPVQPGERGFRRKAGVKS